MTYEVAKAYPISELWLCECEDLVHVSKSVCSHCGRARPVESDEERVARIKAAVS